MWVPNFHFPQVYSQSHYAVDCQFVPVNLDYPTKIDVVHLFYFLPVNNDLVVTLLELRQLLVELPVNFVEILCQTVHAAHQHLLSFLLLLLQHTD